MSAQFSQFRATAEVPPSFLFQALQDSITDFHWVYPGWFAPLPTSISIRQSSKSQPQILPYRKDLTPFCCSPTFQPSLENNYSPYLIPPCCFLPENPEGFDFPSAVFLHLLVSGATPFFIRPSWDTPSASQGNVDLLYSKVPAILGHQACLFATCSSV